MTTIAYRAPYMVSDGRATLGNMIVTNKCRKIFRLACGGLLGLAGDMDTREVVELFDRVRSSRTFPKSADIRELKIDFRGVLAMPDGTLWNVEAGSSRLDEDGEKKENEWYAAVLEINDDYYAVGSGSKWAKAAMDCGASALKAVQIAIKNDAASGGSPQQFELALKPKRKKVKAA